MPHTARSAAGFEDIILQRDLVEHILENQLAAALKSNAPLKTAGVVDWQKIFVFDANGAYRDQSVAAPNDPLLAAGGGYKKAWSARFPVLLQQTLLTAKWSPAQTKDGKTESWEQCVDRNIQIVEAAFAEKATDSIKIAARRREYVNDDLSSGVAKQSVDQVLETIALQAGLPTTTTMTTLSADATSADPILVAALIEVLQAKDPATPQQGLTATELASTAAQASVAAYQRETSRAKAAIAA